MREQLGLSTCRLDVELLQLVSRVRRLLVNGMLLSIRWNLDETVKDCSGQPVYGSCRLVAPGALLISLNVQIVGDVPIARSTAAHELGHAVFDAPAWFSGAAQPTPAAPRRVFGAPERYRREASDWSEWRANEFMGSFLAPRRLLHGELLRLAPACGVPLVKGRFSNEPPVAANCPELPLLFDALGDAFGLTPSFISVRLAKYDLIALSRPREG